MKTKVTKVNDIKSKLDDIFGVAEKTLKDTSVDVVDGEYETVEEEKVSYSVDVPQTEIVQYEKTDIEVIDTLFSLEEKKQIRRVEVLDDDILLARKTLKELIEMGREAMTMLQGLSAEIEEPRVYEVFGELMKSVSDVTKDLIGLHKTRADILKIEKESSKETVNNNLIQNNTLMMTTDDMMKLIKEGISNSNNTKQIEGPSEDTEDEDLDG